MRPSNLLCSLGGNTLIESTFSRGTGSVGYSSLSTRYLSAFVRSLAVGWLVCCWRSRIDLTVSKLWLLLGRGVLGFPEGSTRLVGSGGTSCASLARIGLVGFQSFAVAPLSAHGIGPSVLSAGIHHCLQCRDGSSLHSYGYGRSSLLSLTLCGFRLHVRLDWIVVSLEM